MVMIFVLRDISIMGLFYCSWFCAAKVLIFSDIGGEGDIFFRGIENNSLYLQ